METLKEHSRSLREPQLEPSDHCYVILQDHGQNDGGWGPAAVVLPWIGNAPRPFIYTGSDPATLSVMGSLISGLAAETGKATILAKYTQREDVLVVKP